MVPFLVLFGGSSSEILSCFDSELEYTRGGGSACGFVFSGAGWRDMFGRP